MRNKANARRGPTRKEEKMYCVYFISSDGTCKHTMVHAVNGKDAIICARNVRGCDYDRLVEVYQMVRVPTEF